MNRKMNKKKGDKRCFADDFPMMYLFPREPRLIPVHAVNPILSILSHSAILVHIPVYKYTRVLSRTGRLVGPVIIT